MKFRASFPLSALALFLFVASLLVGCGGGGGGGGLPPGPGPSPVVTQTPVVTPGPTGSPIVVSGSLAFSAIGAGAAANVTFSQSGYSGAYSVNIGTCTNIVSVANGSGNAFTITPLSPGSCSISVTGSGAAQPVSISIALADSVPSVSWNNLGPTNVSGSPGSGKLNALAFDSTNGIYYAAGGYGSGQIATEAGLFKSGNGGTTWTSIMNGISDPAVNSIWIDPTSSSTIVVTTQHGGIFRSTNSGGSWSQVSGAQAASQLLTIGTALYAGSQAGVLVSNDNGATWSTAYPTSAAVQSLASSGSVLYAGLTNGAVLNVSGGALTQLGSLPSSVSSLLVDPANANYLYAAATGSGCAYDDLFVSSDGGHTWAENSQTCSLTGGVHAAMAFDPNFPDRLYILGYGGAYTDNHGASFTHFYGVGDARGLSISSGSGTRFFATSDQGGYTSSDGITYTAVTSPLNVNIVRSVAVNGNTILTSLQDYYPRVSFDGGQTWSQPTGINTVENGNVMINPVNPQYCYQMDQEVNYSTDGCRTFVQSATGHIVGSYDPQALVVDPIKGSTVYALSQSGTYMSTNWGASFTLMSSWPGGAGGATSLAIDPTNSSHLYIGTTTSIYSSIDGGATWQPSSGFSGAWYTFLAVSPNNPSLVLAANAYGGMYLSIDGAHTFTPITNSPAAARREASANRDPDQQFKNDLRAPMLGTNEYAVTDMAFNSTTSTTADLVLATGNDVFASSDLGAHWHDITSNTISHSFYNVKWVGGKLYAGSLGQGVIVSSAVVQTPNARPLLRRAFVVRLNR